MAGSVSDYTDLVARLREMVAVDAPQLGSCGDEVETIQGAADAIERLRAAHASYVECLYVDLIGPIRAEADQWKAEAERLAKERDKYLDALVARHGGEPIALLAELDQARDKAQALDALEAWLREDPFWRDAEFEGPTALVLRGGQSSVSVVNQPTLAAAITAALEKSRQA